jgi:hypothetical protein
LRAYSTTVPAEYARSKHIPISARTIQATVAVAPARYRTTATGQ